MNKNIFIANEIPEKLSKKELNICFQKYKLGDNSAKEKIIISNIRLVIKEAMKFDFYDYNKEELVSIGLIGLIKSVNTYDINKKIQFSTYATTCIRNEILMALRKNKNKIKTISVEETIGYDSEGNSFHIYDKLEDDKESFVLEYEKKEIYNIVKKMVNELNGLEKEIVFLHFGFESDKIYSQKEIAQKFNISQSYVSRILKDVLEEIKEKLLLNSFFQDFDFKDGIDPLTNEKVIKKHKRKNNK